MPKALAEIHNTVRAGNKAFADGDTSTARTLGASVGAMASVLGIDPGEWTATTSGDSGAAEAALDVLVKAELERRAQARADKDWATADEVRDRLAAAGIDVTDTADGATWELKG